ncbi:MAG: aminoacyl-tRNA hydrolase [Proteobacteria bacterium]|nr:aminoacyl-tRNA hydrolase [Pseudomonadota bacterium]
MSVLLVGLGNPGAKYSNNRHNIGFMAVQEILRRHSFGALKEKFNAHYASGEVAGHKVTALMPQTFMNLSGQSVVAAAQFFKIDPAHIIVLHDELDLLPLKVRIKTGGGDGGHNGLKSITQLLGTPNYQRIRIGIGHPGHKDRVSGYVLNDFSKDEAPLFAELCVRLADGLPLVLDGKGERLVSDLAQAFQTA